MTSLNGTSCNGTGARPSALVPIMPPRHRRQRGGRGRSQPVPTKPLGIAPTPTAALPALEAIADYQALTQIADLCSYLAAVDPAFMSIALVAEDAQRERWEFLHQLGMDPLHPEISNRVQILDKVYRLPDRTPAILQELRTTLADCTATAPHEEAAMYPNTNHDPDPTLNGHTPPAPAGLVTRALSAARNSLPSLPTLRLPTLAEALIGAAAVIVVSGVYLACSEIPTPEA